MSDFLVMAEKNEAHPVTVQDDEAYERMTPGERADYVTHAEEREGVEHPGEEVGLPPPPPVDQAAQEADREQAKADRKARRDAKKNKK